MKYRMLAGTDSRIFGEQVKSSGFRKYHPKVRKKTDYFRAKYGRGKIRVGRYGLGQLISHLHGDGLLIQPWCRPPRVCYIYGQLAYGLCTKHKGNMDGSKGKHGRFAFTRGINFPEPTSTSLHRPETTTTNQPRTWTVQEGLIAFTRGKFNWLVPELVPNWIEPSPCKKGQRQFSRKHEAFIWNEM